MTGRPVGSRYRVDVLIGHGGMGDVWKGRDQTDGRPVAVKLLRSDLVTQEDFVSRFLRESRILKALDDPRLVSIIDFVAEGSLLAIVMDFVDGQDLGKWLSQHGSPGSERAVRILDEVLQGLVMVHRAGIVHGDLKPANLMMPYDATPLIRIADFGIARVIEDASSSDSVSQVIGSPPYMAPELIMGGRPSRSSDLYAVGVLAHELLTGRPPFDGGNSMSVLFRHVHEMPARPQGLSDDMWRWVSDLLSKTPSDRPTDAETALAMLRSSTADSAATIVLSEGGVPSSGSHQQIIDDGGGGAKGKTLVLPSSPSQTKVLVGGSDREWARKSAGVDGRPTPKVRRHGLAASAYVASRSGPSRWVKVLVALMALVIVVQSVILAMSVVGREGLGQAGASPAATRDPHTQTPIPTAQLPLGPRRTAGALPDVTGMHVSSAQDTLASYGYSVQLREKIDDSQMDGEVVGQEPGAGGRASDGAVLLTVSRRSQASWLSQVDAIRGRATPTRVDLDDRSYIQGVSLEPACSTASGVSYSLGRRFSRLTTVVATAGEQEADERIRYSIQVDGREVQSGTLSPEMRQPVQIDLNGGGVLRVESIRDSGGCGSARLVLGDPRLVGIPD